MNKKVFNYTVPVIILICLSAVIICGCRLFNYYRDIRKISDENAEIRSEIAIADSSAHDSETDMLSRFKTLYGENSDLAGWIKIDGTDIDYPVMQSDSTAPEFYLNHSFYKEPSTAGTPFLDYRCSISDASDNLIVYGHNMKSGLMFHPLILYTDYEFLQKNRFVSFSTLYSEDIYEIFAVFKYDLTNEQDTEFNIVRHVDYDNPAQFSEFIDYAVRASLHPIYETPAYGDRLLTLITCEYSSNDSRLVVVAKPADS